MTSRTKGHGEASVGCGLGGRGGRWHEGRAGGGLQGKCGVGIEHKVRRGEGGLVHLHRKDVVAWGVPGQQWRQWAKESKGSPVLRQTQRGARRCFAKKLRLLGGCQLLPGATHPAPGPPRGWRTAERRRMQRKSGACTIQQRARGNRGHAPGHTEGCSRNGTVGRVPWVGQGRGGRTYPVAAIVLWPIAPVGMLRLPTS